MGARDWALACILVVATLSANAAAAEPSVRVHVVCSIPGTSLGAMVEILRAELAPASVSAVGVAPTLEAASDVAVAVEACTVAAPAARVVGYRYGQSYVKWIDLSDVDPEHRNRALALALAELVEHTARLVPLPARGEARSDGAVTAPSQSAVDPQPQPAPPTTNQPPAARAAPHASMDSGGSRRSGDMDDSLSLRLAPLFRYTVGTATPFFGADLGVGWHRFTAGLRSLGAHETTLLGNTLQTAVLAVASFDWLSFAPHARLGSGIELGAAIADGSPNREAIGRTAASSHWGATTSLRLLSPIADGWAIEGTVGGGYASSLTVRVDDRDFGTLSGWFLNVTSGVAWKP